MKNAIWKLSALVGVVAIGALVMLQAQSGISRPVAESGTESETEQASAAPDAQTEPDSVHDPQEEPAEEHAGHEHAGHDHADHKHDGADAFQSSGLDFRKPADATAQPAKAPGLLDDAEGDPARELTKAKVPAAAAPKSLDDDPFAGESARESATPAAAQVGDQHAPNAAIKATGHEAEGAQTEPADANAEPQPARKEGAGPRLLDPSVGSEPEQEIQSAPAVKEDPKLEESEHKADEPKLEPPADNTGSPAVAEEIDPFGDAKPAAEARPKKTAAAEEPVNDLGPSLGPKSNSAPKIESPEPAAVPIADPQPDPAAFDSETSDHADEKSTDGAKSIEPAPLKPADGKPLELDARTPRTIPPKSPKKIEDADPAHDEPNASSDGGPRISLGHPDPHAAKELPEDASKPKPLKPEGEPAAVDSAPEEFQGDGTLAGDAPRGPQRPQLTIEKVAPPNAQLGQPLIYSILVKNVGNSTAHQVVVEDRIPKGSKLSGTIPRAELAGKTLIWKLGDLKPDEQRKISIRVVPIEAGQIGSVATVNFVAEVAAETQITAPQLRIDLSGPSEAKLGDPVPFHFRVTNTGSGDANGVVIRDIIPEGLKHAAGNDLEYEVGRLPAGQSREIKLALTAAKIGPTVNRAVVTADGGVTSEAKVSLEVYGAKLVIKRTGPAKRYVDRGATYTNTIINESPRPVETATVTETVPDGMEFVEASNGGQYNEGTRTIAWRLDRLAPAEERQLVVKLIPKKTGTLTSIVRAAATGNEVVETTSQTLVEGYASVGVELSSVDGPVDVGETVTLKIVARNRGNSPATSVGVTIEVPEQFKILSAQGPSKHVQSGNEVRFEPIPTVDGRTSAAFDLVLEAQAKGDARVKVQIKGDQLEKPLTREEAIMVLSDGQ
ncbi:MAG: hypothetical protein AB7O26_08260 [Planctomycetaceae bacterium]